MFNWTLLNIGGKKVKGASYRPQVAFLPMAPKRGTGEVIPQKPSRRYEEEQRKKRKEEEEAGIVEPVTVWVHLLHVAADLEKWSNKSEKRQHVWSAYGPFPKVFVCYINVYFSPPVCKTVQ